MILFFIGALILLAGYVIYLHVQLDKKSLRILQLEVLVEEMKRIWEENTGNASGIIVEKNPNHIAGQHFRRFLFNDDPHVFLYIHYTRLKETAERIMKEGFFFETVLYKTTEKIINDTVDLTYKHYMRKQYGEYVVVIGIAREVYTACLNKIKKEKNPRKIFPEHLLAFPCPSPDEEKNEGFRLPVAYIKGYINYVTGEIFPNPLYNPSYFPPSVLE